LMSYVSYFSLLICSDWRANVISNTTNPPRALKNTDHNYTHACLRRIGGAMFSTSTQPNQGDEDYTLTSGMYVIRCKRICNFWCSMLVLHQLLCVLFTLRGIFMHFLELTY
jgi:hypothetical protein